MELEVDCPKGYEITSYLGKLCKEGAAFRWTNINDCIQQRLDYELNIIHKMKLDSFFLILRDSVQYAKSNGIYVGPGRGSLPSSAVAYSLGITDVDPFKYDLLFERFLASWMTSLEVWIDFEPSRQSEVFDHVNAIYHWCSPKLTISVSHDESCMADMYEVDIIGKSLRNIYQRTGAQVNIDAIDYSDQHVFACVGNGYLNNFSLFSTSEMAEYILEKKPCSMEDLIGCISLEPDRLEAWANNEMVDPYVKACMDNKESTINSKKFKEITETTHGLLVYQEQIIRVFKELAGFSPEQANEARRSLCKMTGIEDYRYKFIHGFQEEGIPGCIAMGLTEDVGEEVYTVTSNMARYCFNKSHAAAMAMLIYLFLWLRCYYPDDVNKAMEYTEKGYR